MANFRPRNYINYFCRQANLAMDRDQQIQLDFLEEAQEYFEELEVFSMQWIKKIEKKKIKKTEVLKKYRKPKTKKTKLKHNPKLPTVSILSTGGTISSKVDYRTGGVYADYTAEELVGMCPEIGKVANVKCRRIMSKMSEDFEKIKNKIIGDKK